MIKFINTQFIKMCNLSYIHEKIFNTLLFRIYAYLTYYIKVISR